MDKGWTRGIWSSANFIHSDSLRIGVLLDWPYLSKVNCPAATVERLLHLKVIWETLLWLLHSSLISTAHLEPTS